MADQAVAPKGLKRVTLAEAEKGLRWSCPFAQVMDVFSFQSEDGEPLAGVKLGWMSGMATIMMEPKEAEALRRFKDKTVECEGVLEYDAKKQKAKFKLGEIGEVQAG